MADIKINALSVVTAADDIQFETDQGGVTAGKITLASIRTFILGFLSSSNATKITVTDGDGLTIQNTADATKQARFSIANLVTGTIYNYILPAVNNAALATIGNIAQTFAGAVTVTGTFIANAASATIGSSTAASTIGIAIGATVAAATKTINIGIAGVSTSITNINIGSSVAGALGTLTINSVTTALKALTASGVITSTLADGTAPMVVTSTTRVANLNVARAGSADAVPPTATNQGFRPTNAQTGTTYGLVLADAGQHVSLTNAAAVTVTFPTNATQAFPVGTEIDFSQRGAGQVSFAAAGGLPVLGKQAPSFIRQRLRGWGMSEVERLVRSLNQYMKNQDVIFELMDEAKVDVYKIEGFNSALLNAQGTAKITERTQLSNMLKNFQNAIVMDVKDEYEQKQQPFTGLAEMVVQNRQGIAADLKMPVTKLFGISAAGFNSGEDDIENYNSMLEGEVRAKAKYLVVDVLRICCKKLFGFVPEDLSITFNPLRELTAKEQEEVKDKRLERVLKLYDKGLMSPLEAKQAVNKDALAPVEIDESEDALPPPGQITVTEDGDPTDGA